MDPNNFQDPRQPAQHHYPLPLSSFPQLSPTSALSPITNTTTTKKPPIAKTKKPLPASSAGTKRRCVSNACVACRKRKSKCDGNLPSCAACASVYNTPCIYDPNSDHRRKGVYRPSDTTLTRPAALQILVSALVSLPEDAALKLFFEMRANPEGLEAVAERMQRGEEERGKKVRIMDEEGEEVVEEGRGFEKELAEKMAQLRMDGEGTVKVVGATSSLALLPAAESQPEMMGGAAFEMPGSPGVEDGGKEAIRSWTRVTGDVELIQHLMKMYFTWHYPYFTLLSRDLFEADFYAGFRSNNAKSPSPQPASAPSPASTSSSTISMDRTVSSLSSSRPSGPKYCSPLLVNAMLALGCHFTSRPGSRASSDPDSTGDHFFAEAKRILLAHDEHEVARLTTVQALALMSVREAGCGREGRGWVYSGMSFRMALDMGLHLEVSESERRRLGEKAVDARRVAFWGIFLIDKCWSNYLGRRPQLSVEMATVKRYEVIPGEEAEVWRPYTAGGESFTGAQAGRTRAVGLQISKLCEISDEILLAFYCGPSSSSKPPNSSTPSTPPTNINTTPGKNPSKLPSDLKLLSTFFQKLESWATSLPPDLQAREGALPPVLLMHMFHQLLYIHLFRPFLALSPSQLSALTHLSPRKACLGAAGRISKFLRFYRREYGLRQICNVAVYIILSAATIHLLTVETEQTSKRDVLQAVLALEEMGREWLCAQRAVIIFRRLVERWGIKVPEEVGEVLARCRGEGRFPDLMRAEEEGKEARVEGWRGEVEMGEGGWEGGQGTQMEEEFYEQQEEEEQQQQQQQQFAYQPPVSAPSANVHQQQQQPATSAYNYTTHTQPYYPPQPQHHQYAPPPPTQQPRYPTFTSQPAPSYYPTYAPQPHHPQQHQAHHQPAQHPHQQPHSNRNSLHLPPVSAPNAVPNGGHNGTGATDENNPLDVFAEEEQSWVMSLAGGGMMGMGEGEGGMLWMGGLGG